MLEKGKISFLQTLFLLINVIGATAIMALPSLTAHFAQRDAWLTPIVAGIIGIYPVIIFTFLGNKFPKQTLFEYLQYILGTWIGKIFGILYLFFFLHTCSHIVWEFSSLLTTIIFMKTPPILLNILMLLLCAYAIYGGIEVLARVFQIVSYLLIAFLTIVLPIISVNADLSRITPVFEKGIVPIIAGSIAPIAWMGEITLIGVLIPYMTNQSKARKCGIFALVTITVILTINTVLALANYGVSTARIIFPTYSMVAEGIFQYRADPIALAFWVLGLFGKIALFYYAVVLGSAQVFNLKYYRPIIIPVGVLIAAFSVFNVENNIEFATYISTAWPLLAILFEYIIPTAIMAAALISRQR